MSKETSTCPAWRPVIHFEPSIVTFRTYISRWILKRTRLLWKGGRLIPNGWRRRAKRRLRRVVRRLILRRIKWVVIRLLRRTWLRRVRPSPRRARVLRLLVGWRLLLLWLCQRIVSRIWRWFFVAVFCDVVGIIALIRAGHRTSVSRWRGSKRRA